MVVDYLNYGLHICTSNDLTNIAFWLGTRCLVEHIIHITFAIGATGMEMAFVGGRGLPAFKMG